MGKEGFTILNFTILCIHFIFECIIYIYSVSCLPLWQCNKNMIHVLPLPFCQRICPFYFPCSSYNVKSHFIYNCNLSGTVINEMINMNSTAPYLTFLILILFYRFINCEGYLEIASVQMICSITLVLQKKQPTRKFLTF